MPRALITGGSGFVGRYLRGHLESLGYEVWVTTASAESQVEHRSLALDVVDRRQVEAVFEVARPDEVYHLAGISHAALDNQRLYYDVNFMGSLNVLEAAGAVGASSLLVSSAYVYGAQQGPISETASLSPVNAYGASKVAAEMAAIVAAKNSQRVVRVRPFNHTGPGQSPRFFVPTLVEQLREIRMGGAEPLLELGNLTTKRDLSDVRDVVKTYPQLLRTGESGSVYNVGHGVGWLMGDIVALATRIAGVQPRITQQPSRVRSTDVPELVADISLLKATIDWQPEFDLEKTLTAMFEAPSSANL